MPDPEPTTLLIATSNPGKRREFAALLPEGVRLLSLDDLAVHLPRETGTTFATNAAAKALAAADQTGLLALADDSGLEVAALAGAPGVRSARFGGEPPSDERNRRALLDALAAVEPQRRAARFVCAVALAQPGRVVAVAEGTCRGVIAAEPRGTMGFGYDPIFLLPDGRTVAELSAEEKNAISHRGIAYRRILPALAAALGRSGAASRER